MADENLNVTITADPSQASAGFTDVMVAAARMAGTLETSGAVGAKAGEAIAQAHARAAGEALRHAESESILGASIGKVEIATNSAARAFGALGIRSAEATERILAVTEALDALEASAGPLLILGAGFLAIGAAVNFVREGIANAAREQTEFTSLAVAVRNQGQSWDEARESIEKFATSLAAATTFSKGEAIAAIDDLTSSGIRYMDAEKMVAIATDVAAAKHVSLISVVDAMKEAEAGRAMGLVKLDQNLKGLIESHARASVVIGKLASDMAGQATAAADTLAGREAQLRNELELVGTTIGARLLPFVDAGVQHLLEFGHAFIHVAESAGDFANAIGSAAKAVNEFTSPGKLNFMFGQIDASDAIDSAKKAGADLQGTFKKYPDIMKEARDEWNKERAQLNATPFERDPILGRDPKPPKAKAEKAAHDETPVHFDMIDDESPDKTDAVVEAQKRLDEQLKATSASEEHYKLAVQLATDESSKNRAETALRNKVAADAAEASIRLGLQIAAERAEIAKLTPEHAAAAAAAARLSDAHDTLGKNLEFFQNRSKVAALRVAELKKEHDAAQKSATALGTSIASLTQQLVTNSDALARQPALAAANAIAQAALMKAYNDSRAAEREKLAEQVGTSNVSLEEERTYWTNRIAALKKGSDDYLKQLADFQNRVDETNAKIAERDAKGGIDDALAAQKLEDEEATYDKSLQQQLAYYARRYAIEVQADGQYSDEAKKYADQIRSLEFDEFKQREDQHKAFIAEFQAEEATIVDDVITKHEHLRDVLKDVWDDMVKNFEKSLEEMVLKSSILNGLNSKIFGLLGAGGGGAGGSAGSASGGGSIFSGLFGGGSGGNSLMSAIGGAQDGGSEYGAVGAIFGKTGGQQIVGSIPTSSGVVGALAGPTAASAIGSDNAGGLLSPGGALGDIGQGGPASTPSGGSGALGGALTGFGFGTMANSILGGNSTWGTVGAAAGAGVGSIFGPAGGEIGGAIGGILGGLFGNKVTAYKNPDIDDTQNYGQTIADLLGHAGANGQTFYEDSTTKSLFNGGTAIQGIEELLSQGKSAFETATGLGDSDYAAALKDFGASATGSGTLSFGKNIGDLTISGAAGAGSTFRYTDVENIIASIEKGLQGTGSSSIPTFSVTRTYGQNPNITGLQADGTITQTPTNVLQPAGAAGSTLPQVVVNVNGNVVGPGGIAGVAAEIGVGLRRVNAGESPGGTSWQQKRFTGGS